MFAFVSRRLLAQRAIASSSTLSTVASPASSPLRRSLATSSSPRDTPSPTNRRGPNMALGAALALVVGGIYWYCFHAVSQIDFSDVDEKGDKKEA